MVSSVPSDSLDELLRQIAWAAQKNLYFLALAGALIVPDICGSLERPDGEATGDSYMAWVDAQLAPIHSGTLDGATCWRFRCSLLHQGTTQHPRSRYSRVLFVEPGATTNVFHMNVMNGALNVDIRLFCLEMVQAAVRWKAAVAGTEPYETNVRNFVTRYPNGLAPYIRGVPVIS
jgi:hypothetical protein